MSKRFVFANFLRNGGLALAAAVCLCAFTGPETPGGTTLKATPVSEGYGPCDAYIPGSAHSVACQDRQNKLEALENAQAQRDQVYAPQVQSYKTPAPQTGPTYIINMPTTPNLFNDTVNANGAATRADAQNRLVPETP